MEISTSYYRSQSITLSADTTQSPSVKDGSTAIKPSSSGTPAAGPAYSQGYTGLQSKLAESALKGNVSNVIVQRNAAGQTLDEVVAAGRVINPAEWLSKSDVELFHKVTGGTIKDGVIYDSNGNEDISERSMTLVAGLYDLRNRGTFDDQGNVVTITGDITAGDLQRYIDHYSKGGWIRPNLDVLYDTLTALTTQDA